MLFQWSEAIGQAPDLAPGVQGPVPGPLQLLVPSAWKDLHLTVLGTRLTAPKSVLRKGAFLNHLIYLSLAPLLPPPPLPRITCPVPLFCSPRRYLIYPDYLVAYLSSVSRCIRAGLLLVSITPGPQCQEQCWPIGDAQ